MQQLSLIYISVLLLTLVGLYEYRKSFKSILFLIFIAIQTYFYCEAINLTPKNIFTKISLDYSEIFSVIGVLFFIGIIIALFVLCSFIVGKNEEYYTRKQKRNNESLGDVAWGVTWRAIAYAITGLWFWKAK